MILQFDESNRVLRGRPQIPAARHVFEWRYKPLGGVIYGAWQGAVEQEAADVVFAVHNSAGVYQARVRGQHPDGSLYDAWDESNEVEVGMALPVPVEVSVDAGGCPDLSGKSVGDVVSFDYEGERYVGRVGEGWDKADVSVNTGIGFRASGLTLADGAIDLTVPRGIYAGTLTQRLINTLDLLLPPTAAGSWNFAGVYGGRDANGVSFRDFHITQGLGNGIEVRYSAADYLAITNSETGVKVGDTFVFELASDTRFEVEFRITGITPSQVNGPPPNSELLGGVVQYMLTGIGDHTPNPDRKIMDNDTYNIRVVRNEGEVIPKWAVGRVSGGVVLDGGARRVVFGDDAWGMDTLGTARVDSPVVVVKGPGFPARGVVTAGAFPAAVRRQADGFQFRPGGGTSNLFLRWADTDEPASNVRFFRWVYVKVAVTNGVVDPSSLVNQLEFFLRLQSGGNLNTFGLKGDVRDWRMVFRFGATAYGVPLADRAMDSGEPFELSTDWPDGLQAAMQSYYTNSITPLPVNANSPPPAGSPDIALVYQPEYQFGDDYNKVWQVISGELAPEIWFYDDDRYRLWPGTFGSQPELSEDQEVWIRNAATGGGYTVAWMDGNRRCPDNPLLNFQRNLRDEVIDVRTEELYCRAATVSGLLAPPDNLLYREGDGRTYNGLTYTRDVPPADSEKPAMGRFYREPTGVEVATGVVPADEWKGPFTVYVETEPYTPRYAHAVTSTDSPPAALPTEPSALESVTVANPYGWRSEESRSGVWGAWKRFNSIALLGTMAAVANLNEGADAVQLDTTITRWTVPAGVTPVDRSEGCTYAWRCSHGFLVSTASGSGSSRTSALERPWWKPPADVSRDTDVTLTCVVSRAGQSITLSQTVRVLNREELTFGISVRRLSNRDEGSAAVRLNSTPSGTATGAITYSWVVSHGTLSLWETLPGAGRTSTAARPWWHPPDDLDADTVVTITLTATRQGLEAEGVAQLTVRDTDDDVTLTAAINSVADVQEGAVVRLGASVGGTATGAIGYSWTVLRGTLSSSSTVAGSSKTSSAASPYWHAPDSVSSTVLETIGLSVSRGGLTARARNARPRIVPITLGVEINAVADVEAGSGGVRLDYTLSGNAVGSVSQSWSCVVGTLSNSYAVAGSSRRSSSRNPIWHPPSSVARNVNETISVRVSRGGRSASDDEGVVVRPGASLSVNMSPVGDVEAGSSVGLSASVGGSVSGVIGWLWSVSSGTLSNARSATPTWTAPSSATDDVTISVTVTRGGLSDSDSEVVDVVEPVTLGVEIDAVGDVFEGSGGVVLGRVVSGSATGAITNVWSVSHGTLSSTSSATPTWTPPADVSRDTVVTISCTVRRGGQSARDNVFVTVRDIKTLSVAIDTVADLESGSGGVRLGATVGGTATGAIGWSWTVNGGSLNFSNVANPVWTPPAGLSRARTVTISVSITRGGLRASDDERVRVTVRKTLTVAIADVPSGEEGTVTRLSATVGGTATGSIGYAWSTNRGRLSDSATVAGSSNRSSSARPYWHRPSGISRDIDGTLRLIVRRDGLSASDSEVSRITRRLTLAVRIHSVPDVDAGSAARRLNSTVTGGVTGAIGYSWTCTAGTLSGSSSSAGSSRSSSLARPYWHPPATVTRAVRAVLSLTVTRGGRSASDDEVSTVRQGVTLTCEINPVGTVDEGGVTRLDSTLGGTATGTTAHSWSVDLGTLSSSETSAGSSTTSTLARPYWHAPDNLDSDATATIRLTVVRQGITKTCDPISVSVRNIVPVRLISFEASARASWVGSRVTVTMTVNISANQFTTLAADYLGFFASVDGEYSDGEPASVRIAFGGGQIGFASNRSSASFSTSTSESVFPITTVHTVSGIVSIIGSAGGGGEVQRIARF